jgi:CheY-like chemotaxis protein
MHYRPSRRSVLIVDDDAGIRGSIVALLEGNGYIVHSAADAWEAIDMLSAQRPDVILTDIYMAAGDGFELINALRSFREGTPIVAMSGSTPCSAPSFDPLAMAQRLGADATIAKPFRAADLLSIIEKAIAGRLAA